MGEGKEDGVKGWRGGKNKGNYTKNIPNIKKVSMLKEIILLRKMLTQDYIQMNHDELYKTIQKHIAVVEKYPANIRSYLEKELGPVSAFVPE